MQKRNIPDTMNGLDSTPINPALPFFYQSDMAAQHDTLAPDESRHIARVLRLKAGACIHITDGKGKIWRSVLTAVSPQRCSVEVLDVLTLPAKKYSIHIAIAPTKNISRIEWFVEKSIEIGVDQLSFICCKNSERKLINPERLTKKAISALKQAKQAWLPIFNPIMPFADILASQSTKFIAHMGSPSPLQHVAKSNSDYVILIGPEGGFTASELMEAQKAAFQRVRLSSNRLRTETAGIVACHTLNVINQ